MVIFFFSLLDFIFDIQPHELDPNLVKELSPAIRYYANSQDEIRANGDQC